MSRRLSVVVPGRSNFVGPAKWRLTLPEWPSDFCRLALAVALEGVG